MALKAGYYGVRKNILDELDKLDGILPADVSKDNQLVTQSEVDDIWTTQAVIGAKNRWNFPAWYGVGSSDAELAFDADTYTVTLTATANGGRTYITVPTGAQISVTPGEKIKFVWNSDGTSADGILTFDVFNVSDTSTAIASSDVRDNELSITIPEGCTKLTYRIMSGSADKIIKMANCMCVLASDPDTTFALYTLTNKELTDSALDQKDTINAILQAASGAADFAAFKTAMGAITPVTRSLSIQDPDTREASDPEPKTKTTKKSTKNTSAE